MGILSRLFGGKNNIIKDPDLGKVRYLEGDHGNAWGGRLLSNYHGGQFEFFIESKEMVLKHGPKNKLLDMLMDEEAIRHIVLGYLEQHYTTKIQESFSINFVVMTEDNENYDAQWICADQDKEFSVFFLNRQIIEVTMHDNVNEG